MINDPIPTQPPDAEIDDTPDDSEIEKAETDDGDDADDSEDEGVAAE